MMNSLIKSNYDAIPVAFDAGKKTLRHEWMTDYKAGRAPMPDEFRMQIAYIKQFLDIMRIKQYEQELREVYIHDGGPTGPAFKAKLQELFKRGMTEEQHARLSKVLGLEFYNKLIGGIDEIHKGGKLTKLFDVKKVLMERNHDAEKLLQQYEDRLKRQGIEQDK